VSDERSADHGLRDRLSSAGEDAFGELAQNLLDNPLFNQAFVAALGAGERALQAQRSAMTALNIPSSSDLERFERRLRSLSDRLEEVEDRLDDLAAELGALRRETAASKPTAGEPAGAPGRVDRR